MDTDTVELRVTLPIRTVVGCGQLLERQGQQVKGVSVEMLVQGTLISMIPWFEKKGWIEPIDDPKMHFVAMFGDQVAGLSLDEPELEIEVGGASTDSFAEAEEVEARVQAKLREQEIVRSNRTTDPIDVPDIQRPPKMDLLKVNRMDIGVLSTIAPKDVMIEKVTKGIGDAVFRAAVEIVYTSLSPELWGTKTAEQAVNDMIGRHEAST